MKKEVAEGKGITAMPGKKKIFSQYELEAKKKRWGR